MAVLEMLVKMLHLLLAEFTLDRWRGDEGLGEVLVRVERQVFVPCQTVLKLQVRPDRCSLVPQQLSGKQVTSPVIKEE